MYRNKSKRTCQKRRLRSKKSFFNINDEKTGLFIDK